MSPRKMTRRQMLYSSALTAVGAALAACGAPATQAPAGEPGAAPTQAPVSGQPTAVPAREATPTPVVAEIERYGEAPSLAEMVAQGQLPPVEERLPQVPLVLQPIDGIGAYGGTLNLMAAGQGSDNAVMGQYGHSPVRWVDDGLGIIPGHIESWTTNADNSEFVLNFRKGLRWSDGEPCTVHDVLFWWNDLVLNSDHPDAPPNWALSRGKLVDLTAVDDYTLKMSFAGPAPLTIRQLANWPNAGAGPRWIVPKHYIEQFHPEYNSAVANFDEMTEKIIWHRNPDHPVLTAYKCESFETGVRRTFVRNPYYYAVDTEGNQLPYIDRWDETMIADDEVQKMTVIQGAIDFMCHGQRLNLSDMGMLKDNEEAGGYEMRLWDGGDGTGRIIYFNHDYPDDNLRELFRNPKFLQAVSHAHDRETIQRVVYYGQGILTTGSMSPKAIEFNFNEEARAFFEEIRTAHIEYDPERAMAMLDEIGVVDVDGDGWREQPDGSKLELRVDISATATPEGLQVLERFTETWKGVGLNVVINQMPSSEFGLFWNSGQGMIRTDWEVGDGPDHLVYPSWVVPDEPSRFAPLSGNRLLYLYTDKEDTELDKSPWDRTPPRFASTETDLIGDTVLQLQELYLQAREEVDEVKRHHLVWDMVRLHKEKGPFLIGCVANTPRVIVVSKRLMNVPTREQLALNGFVFPWIMVYPAITNTETYAFKS